jgi:uncharacterized protein YbjQ (UPF0145 family)
MPPPPPPPSEEDTAAANAESVSRLEHDQLSVTSQERLAEMTRPRADGGKALFTSTLSINEWALTHAAGVRPLGQVLGACVHQIGYQYLGYSAAYGGQVAVELRVISGAWNQARRLALERLTREATTLGADAVIAVNLREAAYDWAPGAVDYVVSGTAVKLPERRTSGAPILTDLTGQEFHLLRDAGYDPVGLVNATSVFFVSPSSAAQWNRMFTNMQNQELPEYTQGIYSARENAISEISRQGHAVGADGVVGVKIKEHIHRHSFSTGYGNSGERAGMMITLHVLGTAIRERRSHPSQAAPATKTVTLL